MAKTLSPASHLPFKPHHHRHHHHHRSKSLLPPIHCSTSNSNSPNSSDNPLLALMAAAVDWADGIKESRVADRRPLYSPAKWRSHRSSQRHLRHLLSSLSSRVVLSVVPPVTALTAVAAALAAYNAAAAGGWLPEFFPLLHASAMPYQLTAPALALLLVFRTEASYGRFEEGRKAWVKVIAGAGEMVEMVIAAKERSGDGGGGVDEEGKMALVNYILAFPVALKVKWQERLLLSCVSNI